MKKGNIKINVYCLPETAKQFKDHIKYYDYLKKYINEKYFYIVSTIFTNPIDRFNSEIFNLYYNYETAYCSFYKYCKLSHVVPKYISDMDSQIKKYDVKKYIVVGNTDLINATIIAAHNIGLYTRVYINHDMLTECIYYYSSQTEYFFNTIPKVIDFLIFAGNVFNYTKLEIVKKEIEIKLVLTKNEITDLIFKNDAYFLKIYNFLETNKTKFNNSLIYLFQLNNYKKFIENPESAKLAEDEFMEIFNDLKKNIKKVSKFLPDPELVPLPDDLSIIN
jgi:hypothetical protein